MHFAATAGDTATTNSETKRTPPLIVLLDAGRGALVWFSTFHRQEQGPARASVRQCPLKPALVGLPRGSGWRVDPGRLRFDLSELA
jgi:hypothetical protein